VVFAMVRQRFDNDRHPSAAHAANRVPFSTLENACDVPWGTANDVDQNQDTLASVELLDTVVGALD